MTNTITEYINSLQANLQHNNSTEHTHRPALKDLIESLMTGIVATNEPKHVACGAPDFVIANNAGHGLEVIGYIETKDVGSPLDQIEKNSQMKRYLPALRNLILTDYIEFRWYVDGELRRKVNLANLQPKLKLGKLKDGPSNVVELLRDFLAHHPVPISSPEELAKRMARLTHLIRDSIFNSFEQDQASDLLRGWRDAFAKILIAGIDQPEKLGEFSDMFAQTLAYGLFSARVMDTNSGFSLYEAQKLIPKTNPFLRKFFFEITGPDLEDEPFSGYVNDLIALLTNTDMSKVLADFGKRTKQEDPVVHFYETFLAAYDPKLRELRGVYYTPQPVVNFIVKSIDYLLRSRFGLKEGLADTSTITFEDPKPESKGKKITKHKVLILDPATGTATFPYAVVEFIRQSFVRKNNAGLWPAYVKDHLLPRLYAFELLIAPYAVAHFKLALQLSALDMPEDIRKSWAYYFSGGERINVFLTNTLDEPNDWTGLPLFTQFLADETKQASDVKQNFPIMVILGNPPYSGHSANQGEWIRNLVKSYYFVDGKPLGEKNPKWLQDDYVKFIRWAQWKINKTGSGVLGFITNHGYLDNPTFRGMRRSLLETFDELFVLDLHGNAKKNEVSPTGEKDENVFDIQTGVAIGIFFKYQRSTGGYKLRHADFWGEREEKYDRLSSSSIESLEWTPLHPEAPNYLFIPQDISLSVEYAKGIKVTELFPKTLLGPNSHRDSFAITFDFDEASSRISDLSNKNLTDEEIRQRYDLVDNRDWSLREARKFDFLKAIPVRCIYRPFDFRFMLYGTYAFDYHRPEINDQLLKPNLALITTRQTREPFSALVTEIPAGQHKLATPYDGSYLSPLYIYPTEQKDESISQSSLLDIGSLPKGKDGRTANLSIKLVQQIAENLQLKFIPDGSGDLSNTFGPEDLFYYFYAICYSPSYRKRYYEFLRTDFPFVPITKSKSLFKALSGLGKELVDLHILKTSSLPSLLTNYPVSGNNKIEKGYPKYDVQSHRVYINQSQYFDGIAPQIYSYQFGGYQVCDKWLKDRRGRFLTYDDLTHYQKIIVSINETMRLMEEIDEAIPNWPIQ